MTQGKLFTGCCFVVFFLGGVFECNYLTVIPSVLNFNDRMEKERPPDPENWDLDTSSTEDKINAYDAVASSYQAGIQPAIF